MKTTMSIKPKIGCGLMNIGNSCYFNASFQALFHIPILADCFQKKATKECKCVLCSIQNFYHETKLKQLPSYPLKTYEALRKNHAFAKLLNGQQQDAHEFIKLLIDQMANTRHLQTNLANKFIAKTINKIQCLKCETVFKNESNVGDFIVDVQGKQSVEEALESYFETEIVDEYKCVVCMENVLASKKNTLVNVPQCMIVVLNRFAKHSKRNSNIEINRDLVLKCVAEDKVIQSKYQLVSTIDHIGQTYKTGHYTATVRSGSQIYTFNDSTVQMLNEISGHTAYVLFYELVEETFVDETEELIEIIEIDEMEFDATDAQENDVPQISNEETFVDEQEDWIDDDEYEFFPPNVSTNDIFVGLQNSNEESGLNLEEEVVIEEVVNGLSEGNNPSEKIQESSRRIVDIQYVLTRMHKFFQIKCKKCGGDIAFQKETRRALISKFHFVCSSCLQRKQIDSCPKDKNRANNNEAAVTGIISIGLGYYHLQEFLTHFNVPCMSYQTFYNVEKVLQKDWWKLAKQLESKSLAEEIRLAKGCNEVDTSGNALIAVKVDGSWPKRSFGNNFSSLAGCAAIVGVKTNKVLFSDVKNKYCHTCKIAASKCSPVTKHECNANWTGPSTAMENAIIVEGFKDCAQKGARFHKFIGDGDSSTYKTLRDLRLYQDPTVYIDRLDCTTHLHKNWYKKFVALENSKKFKPNSRKLISDKIGLDIGKGVRMAAKHWNAADISLGEKCKNLEKDCMNAPLHCLGVHDECSEYFCTKTTSPEARDNLTLLKSEGLLYEILGLCQHYFANKAKSLLAGYDTNVVEGFNSIIAKHLGGKRVNNVLAGSYKSRTAMASVHLNSGYHGISTFQKFKYGNALPETVKMENSRKRKVKMNTIHNEENNKRRRVEEPKSKTNKKRSYASGGIGHEDVDLTPEQFEIAKQRFLNRLNEDRHNRHNILIETQQQKYSVKYCQIKQDLLTSSYFSRILHSRSRKSYKKIVEDILYHNALYTNTADQNHQRLHQSEALKIFSDLYKNEPIELCGIFIDEKYSFLGASPYRLIGRHGILVIKCPRNAFKSTICEAINKKKIPFWSKSKASDTITVNVDSHWYMQIQGQLHVSGKQFAYLMVYLEPSEFKIEKIDRDDEYWKIKMEPELLYFFNEAMLKELVDPRSSRFMELRDYDEKNKIFV